MKVMFICPHWGSEQLKLEDFFKKVYEGGYQGVEMNIPSGFYSGGLLKELLHRYSLKLVAQQYLPPAKETSEQYESRMAEYLYRLASFNPLFINAHTGKDYYDFETNCRLIRRVEAISKETGIKIIHEIHRGRFAYSPSVAKSYFEYFPGMRITADFSHWCCVSESFLEDQEEVTGTAISRADHIHARVGHPQGPQVSHPAAPEWSVALQHHLNWWDRIIGLQKQNGREWFTITSEFGPSPYMPSLPFTNQLVASQWEVNLFMKNLLDERYNR